MIARTRFGSLLPVSAFALAFALAGTGCDGGSNTTSNGGNGGNGTGGSGAGNTGDCATTCEGDTPVCDPESKTCVGCVAESDCADGQYCQSSSRKCVGGCDADTDCTSPLVCDVAFNLCVGCTTDSQCDAGSVCNENGQCVAGCTESQPCGGGLACCEGACTDLQADPKSCGACGEPCAKIPGAAEICVAGQCQMGACDMGANGNYADCNLNTEDGCEWDLDIFGPCTCTPGATQACYTGPAGTQGVGTCVAGVSQCLPDGANWGPCMGQITPEFDTCADGKDNDCNGTPDDAKDFDGDGWTPCDGDCCDVMNADGCADPGLVNPGAFEVQGNMVDDDCDPATADDVATPTCDNGLASNSNTATDYAKAIDLCASTVENPAQKKDEKWGVISAELVNAAGTNSPAPKAEQRSIRDGFGTNVTPLRGSRLAVLSTGNAADANDTNPGFLAFQTGANKGTASGFPADWYAQNGNALPNTVGCDPPTGTTANDSMMLKVRVRVPTNAKSFSVSSFFYSSEYPEWVCSPFNDFFVLLLNSTSQPQAGQAGNPMDFNLAIYDAPPMGAPFFPVGVNLATGANGGTGLFNQCENGQVGCAWGDVSNISTCVGTAQLAGTGFQTASTGCGTNDLVGGGTGWLTTDGNVVPGDIITLRFAVWDTSDNIYDSLVLLDNFKWQLDASTPGTHE